LGIEELGTILNWDIRIRHHIKLGYPWKLYELVPNSCTCKYNLSVEDENIKEVTTIDIGQFLPESACKTLVPYRRVCDSSMEFSERSDLVGT
jgi:hypothetical protein